MMRRAGATIAALLAVFIAGGCMTARLMVGESVAPDVVERRLTIGQSTTADVLALFGEPRGKGRAYFPIDDGPRTLWTYAYSEADVESNAVKDIRVTELWIYFRGDRYDGYLWFSTAREYRHLVDGPMP